MYAKAEDGFHDGWSDWRLYWSSSWRLYDIPVRLIFVLFSVIIPSPSRAGLRGAEALRLIGKTAAQSGGSFGIFSRSHWIVVKMEISLSVSVTVAQGLRC